MNPELKHSISQIKTDKRKIFLQILIIFIFPIILIWAGVIPVEKRVLALVAVVTGLVVLLHVEKWNLRMLGVGNGKFHKYFIPYAVFTGSLVLLIILFGEDITKKEEVARWWTHSHFMYLFFVVSLFQEVAYRGYLMPALGKIHKSPGFIIIGNALLFTFLHSIFPGLLIGLPVAFAGGVGFAYMYYKYPNLPLIILSHSVLNFFIVLFGFFAMPGLTY